MKKLIKLYNIKLDLSRGKNFRSGFELHFFAIFFISLWKSEFHEIYYLRMCKIQTKGIIS